MRKFLLPENGQFYKANLHCHSNLSDGARTPAELKQEYMEQGYSIIAYTDHDVMIPHPELAEANFLPLTGYEMEVNEPGDSDMSLRRTCHMCFIALDPENATQVCYHRTKFMPKCSEKVQHLVKFDEHAPDYERVYSAEGISDMMRIGRENGFFVTYNHPTWSQESAEQFIHYNHMNAMEIYNYSGDINHDEYVPHAYDDMIRAGKRIYCIAADDNHNHAPKDSRRYDSFGGFVMIKADQLEYKTITDALQAGNFYASQGPLIHELWIEDERCTSYAIRRIKFTFPPGAAVQNPSMPRKAKC